MRVNASEAFVRTGIVSIGIIIFTLIVLWKYSIDKSNQYLLQNEELRLATTYIDNMREMALQRLLLLHHMRQKTDPFDLDELNQAISEKASEFMVTRDKLLALNLGAEFMRDWRVAAPLINKTGNAQYAAARLIIDNKRQQADVVLLNKATPFQLESQNQLSKLLDSIQTNSEQAMEMAQAQKASSYISMFVMGTIALVLTIGTMITTIPIVNTSAIVPMTNILI